MKVSLIILMCVLLTSCVTQKKTIRLTNGKYISQKKYDKIVDKAFDKAFKDSKYLFDGTLKTSVNIILPGDDVVAPRNNESDTSHYNVYNVTYKSLITQVFVLGVSLNVTDYVSLQEVEKIDTLQTNVLLINVE